VSTNPVAEFFDPRTLADPYAYYESRRAAGPVLDVSTPGKETYLVIGAAAIKEIVGRPDIFSSRPVGAQGVNLYPRAEALLKEKGFGRTPQFIVMDAPRHTAFRGVLGKMLRDKRFHRMRPQVRALADELIDDFAPAGRCEFTRDFAWKLSVLVIVDLLGVDRTRIDEFKRWSDAWVRPLLQPLTEDEMVDCVMQIAELQHFLVDELAARRQSPRDDLLTDIAHATFDLGQGEVPLRQHEQLGLCEMLIVAGNDTTANALSLGMLRLVERPDIADRIRGDARLIERFAEESLRYEGAVQNNFRTLTQDSEFHGVRMGRGALVLLSWAAANRDPDVYPNPRAFDIDRASFRTHLGFGGGIHTCAGAALARQELVESYDLLLRRLRNLRFDAGFDATDLVRMGGLVSHGLARLPIRFEPVSKSNCAIDPSVRNQ
jgi:cytochrome P450